MKLRLRYLIAFHLVLILLINKVNAQDNLISNSSNVLYRGLNNQINAISRMIKPDSLLVYCDDFEVKDSSGHFYIWIPRQKAKPHRTYIKIRSKSESVHKALDSVKFRIIDLPDPEVSLGSIPSGPVPVYPLLSQHFVTGVIPNFHVTGLRIRVISYRFNVICPENLLFHSKRVIGSTAEPIKKQLMKVSRLSKLIIDSAVAVSYGDTLNLAPVEYFLDSETPNPNLIVDLYDKAGNRKTVSTYSDLENAYLYERKVLREILNGDTLFSAERIDSAGLSVHFKRYYEDKDNRLKLTVDRLTDSSFLIQYFDKSGVCLFKGASLRAISDFYCSNYLLSSGDTLFQSFKHPLDSLQFSLSSWGLSPFGDWMFYHNDGKLFMKGKYYNRKTELEEEQRKYKESGRFVWTCGSDYFSEFYPNDIWSEYDKEGKLLKRFNGSEYRK